MPMTASTAPEIAADSSPGGVRKASPEIIAVKAPPPRSTSSRMRATSASPFCRSLKRIDNRASALAGMTLVALLPTAMSVISILLGWNQSVPLSRWMASISDIIATSFGIGLSARCGYATWPCVPATEIHILTDPRRPIFIMSPSRLTLVGSPTRQASGIEPRFCICSISARVP